MSTTERFLITGVAEAFDQLSPLGIANELYDLTQKELVDAGHVGDRIYEYIYTASEIKLIDTRPQEEQSEQFFPVQVEADGIVIGTVRPANTSRVRALLSKDLIETLSLEMHGGDYKIVLEDGDETFSTETGRATPFAALLLSVKDEAKAGAAADDGNNPSDEMVSFIDTSYALEEKAEDISRRGFVFLLIAALLTTFYLGFCFFYWRDVRSGAAVADYRFGDVLSQKYLTIHLALTGAGLVFNLLSVLTGSCYLPLLSSVLYLLAAAAGPQYILFTAIQAVLCLFASLSKKKGSVLLRVLLFPVIIAVTVVGLLARFGVITTIPFLNNLPGIRDIPLMQDFSYFRDGLDFQEETVSAQDPQAGEYLSEYETESEYPGEWDESWSDEWESEDGAVFYEIEDESEYYLSEDEEFYEIEDESEFFEFEDESDFFEEGESAFEEEDESEELYELMSEEETEELSEAETEEPETVRYRTTSNLNVRSEPNTGSEILGRLSSGTEIDVLSVKDGWAIITYDGKQAYVSETYIRKAEVSPS